MLKKIIVVLVLFTGLVIAFIAIVLPQKEISIIFAGDILLDRGVKRAITQNGFDYPYKKIKEIKDADISFANLECPLTNEGTPVLKDKKIVFKASPENAIFLKNIGFDILNLANNHAMDQDRIGLVNTLNTLSNSGIKTLGAGMNAEDSHKPVFIKKDQTVFGFLGYSAFPPEGYFYFAERPDVSIVNDNTLNEIKAAKQKCDVLIVSFHWGKEFAHWYGEAQKDLAHKAIENGADIIIGHHPHVLQGMEEYRGKYIFYSLGNFVFDKQSFEGTDETVILNVRFSGKEIRGIEIIPIKITDCQPARVFGDDAKEILKKLNVRGMVQ